MYMRFNIVIVFLLLSCFLQAQNFQLMEGDLLFQDSDCGPFCEAIEKVTRGYQGANFSHVAMVIRDKDSGLSVIEATGKGVIITVLDSFLLRSADFNGNPKVIVGRVVEDFNHLIPDAIMMAKSKLGASYDDIFDINNDKYYCSELIYEAFKSANKEEEIFKLYPMTFIDPDSGETFDIWTEYFNELNIEIPEGEMGLNPGGISRSSFINIVHQYGIPDNLKH